MRRVAYPNQFMHFMFFTVASNGMCIHWYCAPHRICAAGSSRNWCRRIVMFFSVTEVSTSHSHIRKVDSLNDLGKLYFVVTHIVSRRVASRRVASRRVASRASRRVASRRVASRRVASRRAALYREVVYRSRYDGLKRQPVQNVVLLPLIIGLCLLPMTRACQRLVARAFGPQLTSLECISGPECRPTSF